LSSIHHAGGSNPTTLENADTTLGIFRTVDTGTQVETYGTISMAETTIAKSLMEDNFIQISIPRSYDAARSPVHRAGTDPSNSLVGMSYAHVGVTSRTDANLDYATDAYDFMYLNSYYSQASTHLQSGDLDNDGDTDADDLGLLRAEFGSAHNPGGRMPSLATVSLGDLPGTGTPPTVAVNATTGELLLIPNGTPVAAIVVPGAPDSAAINHSLVWSGDWLAADMGDGLHWMDATRLGVTVPVLLATFPPGTTSGDFTEAHIGYAGGGSDTVSVGVTAQTATPLQGFSLGSTSSGLEVSFGSQPGMVYQLQVNPTLSGDWTDFGAPVIGDGTHQSIPLPDPAPDSAAFYRVEIQPGS
jgi:hypothetical protein